MQSNVSKLESFSIMLIDSCGPRRKSVWGSWRNFGNTPLDWSFDIPPEHLLFSQFVEDRSHTPHAQDGHHGRQGSSLLHECYFTFADCFFPQIKGIEEEMAKTQKNKATSYHLGQLKAKLAKLKRELLTPSSSGGGGGCKNIEKYQEHTDI